MLKAIIVDDEQNSAQSLEILLHDFCEDVEVMALAANGDEAIQAIGHYHPDVVFLDINLQHESGFDILARIKKINFAIIFTTAYSEFAIKAFRVSALDYLLKPIDTSELQHAVAKVKKGQHVEAKGNVDHLIQHLQENRVNRFSKLAIPSVNGLTFIQPENIVYCEANSNYTQFHLADGTKQMTAKTLKEVEALLRSDAFFRVHNSHVINLEYLTRYDKGKGVVYLGKNIRLDVSKRRKEEFLDKVMGHQKKELVLSQ
jgi:two-component system LytT family response regulator